MKGKVAGKEFDGTKAMILSLNRTFKNPMQEMGARKLIVDKFQEHLHAGFEAYCARHGLEPSEDQLLTYLIDEDQ